MMEIDVNKENLSIFFDNLRKEDLEELSVFLKNNIKQKFIEICMKNNNVYFIADDLKFPLAIGGVKKFCAYNLVFGQVWLLCSSAVLKNKLSVIRYVKNKIIQFKSEYDVLFNYIYKSNFTFLNLLRHMGFLDLPVNDDFRMFYFKKGDTDFDLRYFTCK